MQLRPAATARSKHLIAAVLFATMTGAAVAGPYTGLVVFGDSLSDTGNTSASTLGIEPGSGYFDGRFSNGPLYSERLAEGLGLGGLTRSGAGGDNFAYAGAETDGPGGFVGLFLDSLVEQVDDYLDRLGGAAPDPGTLFTVFIGGNDLLAGQTNVATPVGVVQTQITRLVNAGARTLLGINLPALGLTPDFNQNAASAAAINATTEAFNASLSGAYDAIETANPSVTIHRFDLESALGDWIADPGPLGFTNTTDRGQEVADDELNAPGYVFWDGVHPTREAHALLGEAAIRAVLPGGDYDRDGAVTIDDHAVWSSAYNNAFNATLGHTTGLAPDGNGDGRVDAADYTLWRDALASAPARTVPEPGSIVLLAAAWMTARMLARTAGRG